MKQTAELLKKAITGEFNATRKYGSFSEIAAKEGFKNISYLFKALIVAERVHIKNHKNALGEDYKPDEHDFETGNTAANVQAGIDGETFETKEMYPGFIKESKSDTTDYGKVARLSMQWASTVEFTHAEILKMALAALESGKDMEINEIYICRVCGNLILNKPEKHCPVCGHDAAFYMKVKRQTE